MHSNAALANMLFLIVNVVYGRFSFSGSLWLCFLKANMSFSCKLLHQVLTQDFWLILSLFNADIQDSEGFVVSGAIAMDDGQSSRLSGYENSSLAPSDWHTLAQRFLVLWWKGQTLSVHHLQAKYITQKFKRCVFLFLLSFVKTYYPTVPFAQMCGKRAGAGNTNIVRLSKDNKKYLWTEIMIVLGSGRDPFLVRWK